MNTEALESFAAKRSPEAPAWRPPEMADFHFQYVRTVMSFDPSLRGCAGTLLVLGKVNGEPTIEVLAAKKFTTGDHKVGGFEETLRKTLELSELIGGWILEVMPGYHLAGTEFVHEGPPVGGGTIIRPEASLLGGAALRFALVPLLLTAQPMIQPQTHKRLFCGPQPKNQRITKKDHHDALMACARRLGIRGLEKIKNADERDALSVGLMQMTRPEESR